MLTRLLLQLTSILLLVRPSEGFRSRGISDDDFDQATRSLVTFSNNETDDVLEEPPIMTYFSYSPLPVAPTPLPVVAPTPAPVVVPTPAPGDTLLAELRSFIAPTDADLALFSTPTTPQAQALAWLKTDPINLTAGRSTRTALERYVLAVLYYSTSGTSWDLSSPIAYLSGTSACTWNNGLADIDAQYGVFCVTGDQTSVDRLIAPSTNLVGEFPWELVLLTNLAAIDLDENLISGIIPTRINELTKLELFWAYDNYLSGFLPATFSPQMYSIDLGYNTLSGTIPATFGTNMPSLEYLDISLNSLSGTIPTSLGQIPALTEFYFSENSLTGSVNSFLCTAGRTLYLTGDCQEVACSCCNECCVDNMGCA
jgi:Leucine rich repeat